MKSKKVIAGLMILLGVGFSSCAKEKKDGAPVEQESVVALKEEKVLSPQEAKFDRIFFSMSDRCREAMPDAINVQEFLDDLNRVLEAEKSFPQDDLSLYYLIDKKHTVGSDYEPTHLVKLVKNDAYVINKTTLSLRADVEAALHKMALGAKADGITLDVSSTYRSYQTQENTFNYWVSVDGLEEAERESARPGTSQHQMGTAVDFGNIDDSYANTAGCKWLSAHSEEYGWSLSFPQGYEDVTGYRWECWHFRYIGVEACKFQKKWFGDIQQFMFEFLDAWKSE